MIFSFWESVLIIFVASITTFLTRVIPFIFFRSGSCPKRITILGKILPLAIISTLIIYSIKDNPLYSWPYMLPEIMAIAIVAFLHLWKRNVLLSVGVGTVCYMLLIQFVF